MIESLEFPVSPIRTIESVLGSPTDCVNRLCSQVIRQLLNHFCVQIRIITYLQASRGGAKPAVLSVGTSAPACTSVSDSVEIPSKSQTRVGIRTNDVPLYR